MLKKIDSSHSLVKLLERLSSLLARQRGLPIVIGIALVIVGFVVEILNVGIQSDLLQVIHIIARNAGVLVALIGLLLSEPLGE